jgi:hypothetical protein
MILTDTSFIIDIMKGDANAKTKLNELRTQNKITLVSTISIFELYIGVAIASIPLEEEKKINRAITQMLTVALDENSAKEAGGIYGDLKLRGELIDSMDILVAGIAMSRGIPVLTRNISHFNRITGLVVNSY